MPRGIYDRSKAKPRKIRQVLQELQKPNISKITPELTVTVDNQLHIRLLNMHKRLMATLCVKSDGLNIYRPSSKKRSKGVIPWKTLVKIASLVNDET